MAIQREYTVWCDAEGCIQWERAPGSILKNCKSQWKKLGWTFKGGKWFCPECSKRSQACQANKSASQSPESS